MKLIAYSKALYATWIYYSPDRLLFDAGESVSSILGNKSFAIQRVFLSHGHTDHVAGILGLINIRNSGMGDTEKPLYVYYPRGNYHILELINYIKQTNRHLRYRLEWIPLEAGDRVEIFDKGQNRRTVEIFETVHTHNEISLGYTVLEERTRLKADYQDLAQDEIMRLIREGKRDEITEVYEQRLLSYGGDSAPIDPKKITGTEILCHDTTFLNEEDRKEYKHATLDEAIEVAREAGVKRELLCIHISSRYRNDIKKTSEMIAQKYDLDFEVTLIPPGRIFRKG
ncbi:MAG: MBL fold metallo-hydrolase [Candidatus Bipolaricaulia bacterium]